MGYPWWEGFISVIVGLYLGEKKLPWVTIQWFNGRDEETKRKTV